MDWHGDPTSVADDRLLHADDNRYYYWRGQWRRYYDYHAENLQRRIRGRNDRRKAKKLAEARQARRDREALRARMNPHGDAPLTTILRPNRNVIGSQGTFRPIRPARSRDDVSSFFRFVPGHPGSHRDEFRRRRR